MLRLRALPRVRLRRRCANERGGFASLFVCAGNGHVDKADLPRTCDAVDVSGERLPPAHDDLRALDQGGRSARRDVDLPVEECRGVVLSEPWPAPEP